MLNLLFSLCLGLANAGGGAGVPGRREYMPMAMFIAAYCIHPNLYYAGFFYIPLLGSWIVPGGTGGYMPWIIKKLSFLGFGDNTWRFFEFFSIFVYSLIYLSFGTL